VNSPSFTVSPTILAATVARLAYVPLPFDVLDGASYTIHGITVAAVATVVHPNTSATENTYSYGDPTTAYFNPGLALDANRELTHIYIAENPIEVVLTPHTKVRTAGGGYRLNEDPPRASQTCRFIEGATGFGIGQTRTADGFQETDTHMLLMDWDAIVAIDDTFERDGIPYVVIGIMANNGYSTRAEVMRRG
jgi:hypothetical protein